ncbi:MAG: SpoIIIAH-like family protein [Lachnospiraceae bacterium]|nr:SpoIIIAH-like family protein [Lachnospiraceae bacterium]
MKKVFKKNHVMITALAIMIAVAGYLNFTGSKVDEETMTAGTSEIMGGETGEDVTALLDISEEDLETVGVMDIDSMDEEIVVITEDYLQEDMAEVTAGIEDGLIPVQGEAEGANTLTIDSEPGEAVFTSTTSITSLASARLLKEQTRSQNRAALLEIINSTSADEASIQEATNSMIALTDIAEKETSAEILLEAKGFSEVVVSVTDGTADVVVGMSQLTDAQCAQIIDIVSRKTSVAEENIIITPVSAD